MKSLRNKKPGFAGSLIVGLGILGGGICYLVASAGALGLALIK